MKDLESKLFSDYKHLINPIARKYSRSNKMPIEDLIQTGSIGLLKAIRNFDPNHGQLTAFARRCIDREIFHYVRDRKRLIKISRSLKDLYFRGIKLKEAGYSDESIASQLNTTVKRWQESVIAMSSSVVSLEPINYNYEKNYQIEARENFTLNLRSLSSQELQLAQMFWVDNLTLKEIQSSASAMGFNGNTVKSTLSVIALKATSKQSF